MAPINPMAAALMAFGGGLAAGSGPSRTPVGLGQAMGAGAQQGLGAYMAADEMHRRNRAADLESLELSLRLGQMDQQKQKEAAQQLALRRATAGMSPEQQALVQAAPEHAMRRLTDQAFPDPIDPTKRYRVAGTDVVDLMAEGGPTIALRGSRDGGPLVPVFDPNTGTTTWAHRTEAAGQHAPPKSGMAIRTNQDGSVEIVQGQNAAGNLEGLQKRTAGTIEDRLIKLSDRMQRLDRIHASYKPEFSQILPRAGMEWAALKDKFGQLGEAERGSLNAYTTWKATAYEDLNRTLNELSGAAVTEHEMRRLTQASPKPGEGIFDGDSPGQFEAKLGEQIYQVKLAYARLHHFRRQGLPTPDFAANDDGGVSLDDMPAIIDQRGRDIEAELVAANPDAPSEQIILEVDSRLRREFGI